jgi:hypothetical protein
VRRGALQAFGFVLVWWFLDGILFHGRETVEWAITIGTIMGLVDMAWLYRHRAWRAAVEPVHAFGSASAGLGMIVTVNIPIASTIATTGSVSLVWRIVAAIMFFGAPLFIMVMSAREMWLRRPSADAAQER